MQRTAPCTQGIFSQQRYNVQIWTIYLLLVIFESEERRECCPRSMKITLRIIEHLLSMHKLARSKSGKLLVTLDVLYFCGESRTRAELGQTRHHAWTDPRNAWMTGGLKPPSLPHSLSLHPSPTPSPSIHHQLFLLSLLDGMIRAVSHS